MTSVTCSPWRQLNLTCDDWRTAEKVAATSLHPLISSAQDTGTLTSWWFVRKGDTWRIRIKSPADGYMERARACLLRADGVRRVTEMTYEPETTAFGGPSGMDAAHLLFHTDSRHLLSHIAQAGSGFRRELPVVLASRMLRAARQDRYEQGDCWERLAAHRHDGSSAEPAPATV